MSFKFNPLTGQFDIAGSGSGTPSNSFETIQVPSGTSPVAESPNDILTFAAGAGISIIGDSTTDTVTILMTNGVPLDLVSYTQFGGL
jgi:hypothetical protein